MKNRGGRKPCKKLSYELALPSHDGNPNSTTIWLMVAGKAVTRSDEIALPGAVRLRIRAAISVKGHVLNDVERLTIELLVDRRIVDSKSSIVDIAARWDRVIKAGMMKIDVRQTTPPISRLDAATRRRVSQLGKERAAVVRRVPGDVRARARAFEYP